MSNTATTYRADAAWPREPNTDDNNGPANSSTAENQNHNHTLPAAGEPTPTRIATDNDPTNRPVVTNTAVFDPAAATATTTHANVNPGAERHNNLTCNTYRLAPGIKPTGTANPHR